MFKATCLLAHRPIDKSPFGGKLSVQYDDENLFSPLHSVPNGMKSQTWKFFRLLREIQIHQQTKGLILVFYYQFNQVLVIKSEEIPNISQKFNKNTVQGANSFFNSWI